MLVAKANEAYENAYLKLVDGPYQGISSFGQNVPSHDEIDSVEGDMDGDSEEGHQNTASFFG